MIKIRAVAVVLVGLIDLVLPMAQARAGTLDTSFDRREIDVENSKSAGPDAAAASPTPQELYPRLGIPVEQGRGNWVAGITREGESEKTFYYLIAFKLPISVGAVFLDGSPQTVRALKPDAPFPADPKDASQWTDPVTAPAGQHPEKRLIPMPAGTKTRAILLTDVRPRGTSSINSIRLYKTRLYNLTPHAYPYAESEYTTISTGHGPSHTFRVTDITTGRGAWQNTGPTAQGRVPRPPVSDVDPSWFILTFNEPREIGGVWVGGNINEMEADSYAGSDNLNPRAGTEKEWKKIRDIKATSGPGLWLEFPEPITTRGLRLRITKVGGMSPSTVRMDACHVYSDLKDAAPPPITVGERSKPPVAIKYTLENDGIVTMVVNDPQGRRIRNLISRVQRPKGENVEHWDLRDEQGQTVTPGAFKCVVLTHPGLTLRYEMTPYPDVVNHAPENAPWLTAFSGGDGWMADHTPPQAAAVSGDRVYLGSPVSESGVSLIECDLTGKKLWAHPSFAGFTGTEFLAADDKTVYSSMDAANTAAGWKVDPATEAVWSIDRATHEVKEMARLQPTAERRRGMQGMAARDGKLYVSIRANEDWLAGTGSSADVDIEKCLPVYKEKRQERFPYEIVPDPRNDFMRLFRLTGGPPGYADKDGYLTYLRTSEGKGSRQHIVLAFKKPVALGSAVFPVPQDDKVQIKLSVLKADAPYPPVAGNPKHWEPFETHGKAAFDVATAPPNITTRALRISFVKGEDDLFTQTDDTGNLNAKTAIDAGLNVTEDVADDDVLGGEGNWSGALEGLKLLRRRYENVAPQAKVVVSSGEIAKDGTWDARRSEPISPGNPGIYMLQWPEAQSLRGLAIREIDGKFTDIDVYTGDGAPEKLDGNQGWETITRYEQKRRVHHDGSGNHSANSRYVDGYVDFGKEVKTRAVRLRVVEQWTDTGGHGTLGIREDQGGSKLDPKRCRVFGVAAMKYVGGEVADDPLTYERIEIVDSASGKIERELPLVSPGPIAFNRAGDLIAISGKSVVKIDVSSGTGFQPVQGAQQGLKTPATGTQLAEDLISPISIACDSKNNIYVFDTAPDRKVIRVYDSSGKHTRDIGERGGYVPGPWNVNRLQNVTGLAIDAQDQLWAVDNTYFPKRISLWSADDGAHKTDFFGNTWYGGGGSLDPWDKTKLYFGTMEFELDWKTGKTRMKNLLAILPPFGQADIPIVIDGRRYMVNPENGKCGIVYRYVNDHIELAAAVGNAAAFGELAKADVYAKLGFPILANFTFIFCDRNADGKVQRDEVELKPKPKDPKEGLGHLSSFNRDLGVQAGRTRYVVKEFLASGVPVYEEKVVQTLPNDAFLFRLDNGEFHSMSPGNMVYPERGFDAAGKLLWTYPTLGSGGHAIGRAQNWHTGQVVCQLGIIGHDTAPKGDLGEFVVFHNNLGIWNLWTSDGILAAQIFRDLRDPKVRSWNFKEHDRGMELKDITVGQEHFQGYFTRTFEDDKFYVVAGHNHASVVEVVGLDQFKRINQNVEVSVDDLVKTQEWEKSYQTQQIFQRAPVIDCYRMNSPQLDGRIDDWGGIQWAKTDDNEDPQFPRATFAIGYDDKHLYVAYWASNIGPLKNSGEQWDRLFKTGASVDLQIAANPDATDGRKAPEQGDKRLLMTLIEGKPVAVLYDAVVPGTPADKVWQAVSPVARVQFDVVKKLDDVRIAALSSDNGYTLEAAIPLASLGVKPTPNLRLKFDWGVIVTDSAGNVVLKRDYWANKATGIIADVPSEARLQPDLWGHIIFRDRTRSDTERAAAMDPLKGKGGKTDDMLKAFEDELND